MFENLKAFMIEMNNGFQKEDKFVKIISDERKLDIKKYIESLLDVFNTLGLDGIDAISTSKEFTSTMRDWVFMKNDFPELRTKRKEIGSATKEKKEIDSERITWGYLKSEHTTEPFNIVRKGFYHDIWDDKDYGFLVVAREKDFDQKTKKMIYKDTKFFCEKRNPLVFSKIKDSMTESVL